MFLRLTVVLFFLLLSVVGQAQTLLSVTHGTVANGLMGNSVCPGPDWDGDGVADVIAGAPEDPAHQPSASPVIPSPPLPPVGNGRLVVISGGSGAVLATVMGPFIAGRFGYAVHAPGDLDGDGVGEVAVGAPAGASASHVVVLSGATLQPLYAPLTAFSNLPSCSTGGINNGWLFGHAIASGDLSGDGVPDLCVGAPVTVNSALPVARIQVNSGVDGSFLTSICAFPGGLFWDYGWAVADPADLDADGIPDLIGTSLLQKYVRTISGAGGSVLGNMQVIDVFYGQACARIPDQDGDGVPDVAVSAPGSSVNGVMTGGRVVIHSGANLAILGNLFGTMTGEYLGWSMDARGDFDGDGVNDLALGAPGFWTMPGSYGSVEVYSGATLQLLARMTSPVATNAFGWSVAFVGDLTGDGRDELAVGAPAETANGVSHGGAVYLYSGLELPAAALGGVGLPLTGPESVLLVNGLTGGTSLRVQVGLGRPFSLAMNQPTTTPTPAAFTLFAAVGLPTSSTVYSTAFGDFAITPQLAAPANPLLFHVADSFGIGGAVLPASPAPWAVLVPQGLPHPLLLTFQGIIAHMPGIAPGNLAITNAVILDVR